MGGAAFGRTLLGNEGRRCGSARRIDELEALRGARIPAVAVDRYEARTTCSPVAQLPDGMLLFDPLAGAIRAHDTVLALAAHIGSALRRADVKSIALDGDSVRLETADGAHRSDTGAWSAPVREPAIRLVRPLGSSR